MHRRRNSFILLFTVLCAYLIAALLLKDRNDLSFLLMFTVIMTLFLLSCSKICVNVDRFFTFLFPIAVGITRNIWIAHPLTESLGILQIGAGLFVSFTDVVIVYFAFRCVDFELNRCVLNRTVLYFLFSVLVSCVFAHTFEFSLAGIFLYLKCYMVYRWFSGYPEMNKLKKPLINGVEVALVFQGIIAVLQNKKNGVIGLQALGETDEAMRYRLVGGVVERSPAGLFEHSSKLAIFAIFALLFILFCEEKKIKKYVFFVLGMYVLYIAAARTAIVAIAIALIYNIWRYRARIFKRRNAILLTICVLLLVVGGFYLFRNNQFDFFTSSDILYQIGDRLSQFHLAFTYIFKRWGLIGYGINNYTSVTTEISTSSFIYLNPVHNNFILYWFELGIFGFLAFVSCYFVVFKLGRKFNYLSQTGKAAFLFILSTLIYNLTGWAFAAPTCIFMFWVSLGLVNKEYK